MSPSHVSVNVRRPGSPIIAIRTSVTRMRPGGIVTRAIRQVQVNCVVLRIVVGPVRPVRPDLRHTAILEPWIWNSDLLLFVKSTNESTTRRGLFEERMIRLRGTMDSLVKIFIWYAFFFQKYLHSTFERIYHVQYWYLKQQKRGCLFKHLSAPDSRISKRMSPNELTIISIQFTRFF